MNVIALLVLVAVIAIGAVFNKNIGIISLGVAMVLGYVGGISSKDIIAGFPSGLFLNMTGMFFFFAIAQNNRSLELLSKKLFQRISKVRALYPIMVYLVCAGITVIDPGGLTAYTCAPLITMSVGYYLGYAPLMIGCISIFAANATIVSKIGVFGSAIEVITSNAGYQNVAMPILLNSIIIHTINCVIVFVIFKGWKLYKMQKADGIGNVEIEQDIFAELEPFNRNQKITLFVLLLMVLCTMILKTHAGLTAFFFAIILLLLKCAPEKETFRGTPWETIFLCVGIGVLLAVIQLLGGLDLLASLFSSICNRWTAAPMLSITSSVMSFFSLAVAGPIPTLIPTIVEVNASIGNAFLPIELISTVVNGAFSATVSPLSLGGAIILASYDQLFKPDSKEKNKVFRVLFGVAILCSVITAIISNLGLYKFF